MEAEDIQRAILAAISEQTQAIAPALDTDPHLTSLEASVNLPYSLLNV
jgi:hypothetical protein